MVSIGSKALSLRKHIPRNLTEDCTMAGESNSYNQGGGRRRSMNRKSKKNGDNFDRDHSSGKQSGGVHDHTFKQQNFSKHQNVSEPHTSFVRKRVDPETAKYFSEIANVIESNEIDLEERSVICGNALEETTGKQVALATDYILSHTMQTLVEGCDLDHLCDFLKNCAEEFHCIAMDRSGSHVAETALKSLTIHLAENGNYSLIEETLTKICQAIVVNPIEMMCNCYGSHVLRSLLCLCKGVPLDSAEFRGTKSSSVLAERLNFKPSQQDDYSQNYGHGFPNLLKFLVSEMLNSAREDISTLQVNQYSSLVLQTALKLLAGQEEELLHIIPVLLGCSMKNASEGNFIKSTAVKTLLNLMKETAYSRLMEVILEVAPKQLYNELFVKVFRNSLFEMSSDPCGNFVVQALVSHARSQDHLEMSWEELGSKFEDLLAMGKSGVVASLIAASQRLHSHEHKCCQALAAAICSENESPKCIVPRILFLDNYFSSGDKSNWSWRNGVKMHVMGCLILQSVFRIPSEFIQAYISSITSMEADHVLQAAKDSGGARVIEAFLGSNVSTKNKSKLLIKLRGHFAELSMHTSGSFTVEKCFNAGNMSLREAIVSELLAVEPELSKTKQGPYLLRKLDVDGYAKRPEQWKSRQVSKESTYKDFFAEFGSTEPRSSKSDTTFIAGTHHKSKPENLKEMRKEIDARLSTSTGSDFLAHKNKKHKKKGIENANIRKEIHHENTEKSVGKKEKKRHRKDYLPVSSSKKIKSVK